jgi:hypothetical protein
MVDKGPQIYKEKEKEQVKFAHEFTLTWGSATYTIRTNNPPKQEFYDNGKPVPLSLQAGPKQYAALREMLKDGTIHRDDGTEMKKDNPLRQFMLSELRQNADASMDRKTGVPLAFRLEPTAEERKRALKNIGVAKREE